MNINDCASQPCKFGGKCQDQENGFHCLCLPGYEGEVCDQGTILNFYLLIQGRYNGIYVNYCGAVLPNSPGQRSLFGKPEY